MLQIIDASREVLFSTAEDLAGAQRVSRLARAGKLRKIHAGVYTSNLTSSLESVVQRNWRAIAEHLFPNAVVAYRSAATGAPVDGKVFLVKPGRARRVTLPGIEFVIVPGAGPIYEDPAPDAPYGRLFLSSEPRRLMENLRKSKGARERAAGQTVVEAELDRILSLRGERGLNALRDNARAIAPRLGLQHEFALLDKIVSALFATHDARVLKARSALARAAGKPHDPDRLPIFDALFGALNAHVFQEMPDPAPNGASAENFAFFESYFSNFIEGTQFTVDEAEEIIFHNKIIENRSQDSHDVRGTYEAALGSMWRSTVPKNADDFLRWVKSVNAVVLQARPDQRPGEWKERMNQAGSTLFVMPELVPGTLIEGYERVAALREPMAQALMAMFVVTEVHPFSDGNGRTARLLMNAYLTKARCCRIMVPIVYREDCFLPLKALSRHREPAGFIGSMERIQRWAASFDWNEPREKIRAVLDACHAFKDDLRNYRLIFPETLTNAGSRSL